VLGRRGIIEPTPSPASARFVSAQVTMARQNTIFLRLLDAHPTPSLICSLLADKRHVHNEAHAQVSLLERDAIAPAQMDLLMGLGIDRFTVYYMLGNA
jgi:hypothetical protein